MILLSGWTMESGRAVRLDQQPAGPGEWGYRPGNETVSPTDPPSFSWRPQPRMTWELECSVDQEFRNLVYRADDIRYNVHCPDKVFGSGAFFWRYRGRVADGGPWTEWSQVRGFRIGDHPAQLPMPARGVLIDRIPRRHPRLFLRPENLDSIRALAKGPLREEFEDLVRTCDRLLNDPPPTKEPPTYPEGMERKSEEWREIWWGNRTYTIRALNGAATLAFTWLIGGNEEYGQEARRILLECAGWDPKGSTGYRYNDEAGMPYNYYFSRTYTFVNDLLTEEERARCRAVMKVRGDEMYGHLTGSQHFWRPYSSHSNRAWHFLGEIGIAFLGEIADADEWVWFAANVFFNTYPVWSDADGGWHEGMSYWSSYIGRFTWWADVMREALGIDAFDHPYFSQVGYYAMYLMPPGKTGGGFGDLTAKRTADDNRSLMTVLAAQAQNPYWQWYVEQLGGAQSEGGYIGFLRGRLPAVEPQAPAALPTSRLFRGTGQAYLNSSITDAGNSVQVVFKSSPFGTQSHGYESNNSFLLWALGERILIRSGYRDIYGSAHHQNWMWSTRSTNCIRVDARDQMRHTAKAQGEIIEFRTSPEMDLVTGDAAKSYSPPLKRFTRSILFVKPDWILVYDCLAAPEPAAWEYWLHAREKFDLSGENRASVRIGDVACEIEWLHPLNLNFSQTNQYDPNPRERIQLREWHLTAVPEGKTAQMEWITVYRPYRATGNEKLEPSNLEIIQGGYLLRSQLAEDTELTVLLSRGDLPEISAGDLRGEGMVTARLKKNGNVFSLP
jgi:hypothetical protein